MFVTSSNFIRKPYSIPNVNANLGFDNYADQEERSRLKKLLGVAFYTEFNDALIALPDWVATEATVIDKQYAYGNDVWKALTVQTGTAPVAGADWELIEEDNKYLLLKNGEVFEYNNQQYEWGGMVELFKPYVYSKYVEHNTEEFSGTGVTISENENSKVTLPVNQICNSWNDFAERAETLYRYLIATEEIFSAEIIFKHPGRKNFAGI